MNYPVCSERHRQEVQQEIQQVVSHLCRTTLPSAGRAGKGDESSQPNGWQGGPSLPP